MDLKPGKLNVDSVQFYNTRIFDKSLTGRIQDQVYIAKQSKEANYPKFSSYKNTHRIEGFFKDIVYIGGFSMEGRSVIGTGSKKKDARIKVFQGGNLTLTSTSHRFLIGTETIDASKTTTSVYFKGDSLHHTNIKLEYRDKEKKLTLSTTAKGLGESPFYDSYHNMEVEADIIEWKINKPFLTLRMTINAVDPAQFRSDNFFSKGKYQKVKGILERNPLKQLYEYAQRFNSMVVSDRNMADFMGIQFSNMRRMLVRLAQQGFISYYMNDGEFIIKDKLVHYIKADKKLTDYDNILLKSNEPNANNGKLYFNTGELKLDGIKSTTLSDKQNVHIYPRNQELTILENRDMEFDGQMTAGRFHYFGDNFSFEYDSFKVDMTNVDSMMLYFPDEESGELIQVKNVLQDLSGSVLIDHPNNKSGKVDLSKYPIFDCKQQSAVYYEKPNIFNNVYQKDSFYFQIKPFMVDSLDNFKRKGIEFDGTFYSANILPVFDYYVTLMEDNSLGFSKRTPPDGYPLYGGKGTGFMQITLSNKGLRGNGKINYLTSETESRNFLFFPDSMNAHSESFNITEEGQNKYPPVTGKQVFNHWMPYKDSMYIQEKEPLSVYNENVKFEGDLILTPKELYGTGMVKFDRAIISSNAIALKPNNVKSDSASFRLKSDEKGKPTFFTDNTSLNLNLQAKKLTGATNGKETKINLKKHQYQTTIENYTWNIEDKNIYMQTPPDQTIDEAFMLSTNPTQDSLQFNTTAAFFDLKKSIIEARNIPHIDIADAQVYPNEGKVTIEESSKLRTLKNAKIRADTTYFFHDFYDATINILSKNDYGAKADYTYEGRNDFKDTITFEKIHVNADHRTVATANISKKAAFHLSPRLKFNGQVNLKASRQELAFDGLLMPENVKPTLRTQRFRFADTVYPDSIYIEVDKTVNKDGDRLYSGVFIDQRKDELYNLFMGEKKNQGDYPLFKATGYLYYDYYTGQYTINKQENINKVMVPMHQFTYSDQNHQVKTTGDVNLNFKNEHVNLRAAGNILFKPADSAHELDLALGIDFKFDPKAVDIIADSVNNLAFYRPDTRDGRELLRKVVPNIVKQQEARNKILQSLREFDMMVTNEAYRPTFLFSQLTLKWDRRKRAFVNKGPLGLGTIDNTAINKQLKGKFLFKTGIVPDQLRFYISSTKNQGNYYYFNITNENCRVFSSDYNFKKQVNSTSRDFSEGDYNIHLLKNAKEKIFFERLFKN